MERIDGLTARPRPIVTRICHTILWLYLIGFLVAVFHAGESWTWVAVAITMAVASPVVLILLAHLERRFSAEPRDG